MAIKKDKTSIKSIVRAPKQDRARVTVEAILESAVQILETDGLAGFKVAALAERSGYGVGTVSPNIVSFNGFGSTAFLYSSAVFTVNSLYATAAWYDDLQVTFSGWADGTEIYSMTVSPSATAPTLYTFDWSGIDAFFVDSSGGTQRVGYVGVGVGAHVAMDNITVNEAITAPVPEPETSALMLAGLGLVGFMARRRKAK